MRILITGNMGYVGPCLVKHLRSSFPDVELIGVDMGYFANCLTNKEIFPECRVDLQYFADVRYLPADTLKGVEAIVHLSAISNDPMSNIFEQATYDINYQASSELAAKAKQVGIKTFVFASSCSMYGFATEEAKTEQSSLNPLTAYAKSKVLTEKKLKEIANKDFLVTSLRFATACGMSDRLRLDLVLNDFVAGALASKKITILSDGTPWRPLINVKDMARAIDWAIQREQTSGESFLAVNVGSNDWNYQVRDLAEAVARVIPGVEVAINKDAQPDKRSYRVNFGLFRQLAPDFQPAVDLTTTIEELRDGLKALKFRKKNFRNSNFIRLEVLRSLCKKGLLNDNLEWLK